MRFRYRRSCQRRDDAVLDRHHRAAAPKPSVMLFEDAHWADPTTLEVLDCSSTA